MKLLPSINKIINLIKFHLTLVDFFFTLIQNFVFAMLLIFNANFMYILNFSIKKKVKDFMLLIFFSIVYIRKYWNREHFRLLVFDEFTRFGMF